MLVVYVFWLCCLFCAVFGWACSFSSVAFVCQLDWLPTGAVGSHFLVLWYQTFFNCLYMFPKSAFGSASSGGGDIYQTSLTALCRQSVSLSSWQKQNDYLQAALKTHTGKQLTASVTGAEKVSVDAALAALSSESGQFPQRKRTALFSSFRFILYLVWQYFYWTTKECDLSEGNKEEADVILHTTWEPCRLQMAQRAVETKIQRKCFVFLNQWYNGILKQFSFIALSWRTYFKSSFYNTTWTLIILAEQQIKKEWDGSRFFFFFTESMLSCCLWMGKQSLVEVIWKSWSAITSLDILQDIIELHIIQAVVAIEQDFYNESFHQAWKQFSKSINLLLFINP